jgi:glycosyltransferase involved in cell wall biosynthesis
MVLLIGNYSADHQHSMERFSALMLQGLRAANVDAELIVPLPFFGNLLRSGALAKWLGYIDKYIFFPFQLRKHLSRPNTLVHICDHSNAVYVERARSVPVVVTCHDLLAVRGGLGEQTDCPASITGRFLQSWILRGLRRADAVACVSRATARDAERLIARENSRAQISVVPLALNFDYRKISSEAARAQLAKVPQFDVDLPFVLHVGSNLRRKNRDGVLRIFARCKDQWTGRLVFAGQRLDGELTSIAKSLGVSDRIVQVENPDGELLRALYNSATAFLFPSRFEGFGWPIMEAQACGCPVICTNSGPMPEAAGDAGLYHEVDDETGFAVDLMRMVDPAERAKWSEKSLRSAERFSTKEMIARYIDIYRQLGAKL